MEEGAIVQLGRLSLNEGGLGSIANAL